jgi:hypothetical protein
MNRLKQFVDYANKVFGLREFATGCRDSRVNPQYPCATIIALFVASIAARVGSLYQIERMGKSGELDRFIHTREKPSADTLGRWLAVAGYSEFRSYNGSIVQRARRNKVHAYGTICGWRVAAIDGTETFCTQSPTAEALKWSKRTLSNGAIEYYERAAVLSYIGAHPHLILDMERIEPGEGEVTAAIRLLEKTQHRNWRYCDMVCADALYARAPFINAVSALGKWVIIKLKQDNYHLVRDMDGLVADRSPDVELVGITPKGEPITNNHGVTYNVEIWDEEGFTSWDGVDRPLRCLKVVETKITTCRGEVVKVEKTVYHIVTTAPKSIVKAVVVWQIMHRRWDIENSIFNDLKQNWGFDHCYTHDINGIQAMYALFCIVFNLVMLFAYRNLKDAPARGLTLKELARQMLVGMETLCQPITELLPRASPG